MAHTLTPGTKALARVAIFFSRVARVFVYLGMGTLRLNAARNSSLTFWDDFNDRPHDVAEGLSTIERDLFARWLPPGSRILLVGAGTGRDLIALAEQGHRLSGVEPSARAVALNQAFLRDVGIEATLLTGFFEDVDLSGPFDAVIFSYFCYSYIPVSVRRVEALRKAAGLLAPGGRVLVSYGLRGRPHPVLPRLASLAAAVTGSDWRLEPGDSVSIRFESGRAPNYFFYFEHQFEVAEVLAEVAAADLQIVHHRTEVDYPWVVCTAR